jgi:hypothetical protein
MRAFLLCALVAAVAILVRVDAAAMPRLGTNEPQENFDGDLRSLLERQQRVLLHSIRHSQAKKTVDYEPRKTYPPLKHWARQAGIYDSFVHLNFHGDVPRNSLLRNGHARESEADGAGTNFPTITLLLRFLSRMRFWRRRSWRPNLP